MKITTTINGNEVTTEGTIEEVCDFLRKIKEDNQDELVNKKEDNVEQEKNPLNLEDDKIYYIKPLRDDSDEVSGAVRLSIDEISYLFIEEETRNMVLVYFDDVDKINKIEFYEDDESDTELKIEDLKDGTYFIEGKIEDQFGDFVQNEHVEITNKINEGLVRIDSKESILPVVMKTNDFEEQLKNTKLIPTLEETYVKRERKFEQGDLVEVLESFGGVEEGNYGIVTGYDEENARNIYLAGYDKFGIYSKSWVHAAEGLKLIKE